MLAELVELLSHWQVWAGMLIFGVMSRGAMTAFTPASMSNRSFAILMTLLNISYVMALLVWLAPILVLGDRAYGQGSLSTARFDLVHFVGYGLLARFFLGFFPWPTPNPKAGTQGVVHLATVAFDMSRGTARLWPGWSVALALILGTFLAIGAVEAFIGARWPERQVTRTVTISGFLMMAPVLAYAAWLRAANGGFSWIP
jgi:hypothetical protein